MRTISSGLIKDTVRELCLKANFTLRPDVRVAIKDAIAKEQSEMGRDILQKVLLNAEIAQRDKLPICQDTGYVTVIIEIGQEVHIEGNLEDAVNAGVAQAYTEGYLRKSMVAMPIFNRSNTEDNTPAFLHTEIVHGDALKIIVMPKGGGTENASAMRMLPVSGDISAVKDFVIETAENAAKACPPVIMGVGIGGSFDTVAYLAKKALLRPLNDRHPDSRIAALEDEFVLTVNGLGIGPAALGGTNTVLDVKVEVKPTHIACLPAAVAFNCVAARQAQAII